MAADVGIDPVNDIHWVTGRSPTPAALFADRKIDAFLGFPPEPAGSARPPSRTRDRQHWQGPALVAIFLLHAGGQSGLRAVLSGGNQARDTRHSEGHRPMRQRA